MMPATGVFAPDRTFVAVRAIAPVAGSPPTSGDAMFAMPCATSSTFGLCRSPLIRSATVADISDSIAPSIATVIAGIINGPSIESCTRGTWSAGSPAGTPPKRVPRSAAKIRPQSKLTKTRTGEVRVFRLFDTIILHLS